MLIGYARISTTDQTMALQQDALTAAGCHRIFTDTASGSRTDRPGLAQALSFAREGDTLVVWRLDRLGRSLAHLIQSIKGLHDRGVQFRSLQEQLDTGTSGGKLVFHIFGALAEFESDLIRERTQAGLAAARARGRQGGRRSLSSHKVRQLRTLAADRTNSVAEVCQTLGISRATFYRYQGPLTSHNTHAW
jgi:DNA invertase Pin-like site-specific DNA recombinase